MMTTLKGLRSILGWKMSPYCHFGQAFLCFCLVFHNFLASFTGQTGLKNGLISTYLVSIIGIIEDRATCSRQILTLFEVHGVMNLQIDGTKSQLPSDICLFGRSE